MLVCEHTSHNYNAVLNNPNNYLEWTATGNAAPVSSIGNNTNINWGQYVASNKYTLLVREVDPNTSCKSVATKIRPGKKMFFQFANTAFKEFVGSNWKTPNSPCVNTNHTYRIVDFSDHNVDSYELNINPGIIGSIISSSIVPGINTGKFDLELIIQWNNTIRNQTQIVLKSYTCGTANANTIFLIDVNNGGNINITNATTQLCQKALINLNTNLVPTLGSYNTITWDWDFGQGFLPMVYSPNGIDHAFSGAGLQPISVNLSVDGCIFTGSTSITLDPAPDVTLFASSDHYCTTPVTIQAVSVSDPMGPFLWSTNATSSQISINASGDYSVTITSANHCTNEAQVTIKACECIFGVPNVTVSGTSTSSASGR